MTFRHHRLRQRSRPKACAGRSLYECFCTINLEKVTGELRVPAAHGEAELEIKDGKVVSVKVVPGEASDAHSATTRSVDIGTANGSTGN